MALAPSYGFDPLTGKGFQSNQFEQLLDRIRDIPPDKICFFEISDVLKPDPPLKKGSDFDAWHDENGSDAKPRSSWVLCARCTPYVGKSAGKGVRSTEDLGSARVAEIAKAVFSTGFRGLPQALPSV